MKLHRSPVPAIIANRKKEHSCWVYTHRNKNCIQEMLGMTMLLFLYLTYYVTWQMFALFYADVYTWTELVGENNTILLVTARYFQCLCVCV
uniref:Uncharacterized protein n=1 Tax=Arion vulgaris TaxID=1028688 RepID=A0A0B7A014_9EUPU